MHASFSEPATPNLAKTKFAATTIAPPNTMGPESENGKYLNLSINKLLKGADLHHL